MLALRPMEIIVIVQKRDKDKHKSKDPNPNLIVPLFAPAAPPTENMSVRPEQNLILLSMGGAAGLRF